VVDRQFPRRPCFVHDELSAAALDLYDRDMPGALERRAGALMAELRRLVLVVKRLLNSELCGW
jgi:hypothetical protein